jgi:predicted nuclease of predicted toxin-antitoxin system
LRFIVDAQLPPALARALERQGFGASYVFDMSLWSASDKTIWNRASDEAAVIITKDADFAAFRATRKSGPPVVWLRIGNTANDFLIPWLLPLMPQVVSAIEDGEVLIELR